MPNPFCHVELNTENPSKAESFYTKLFDWKLNALPGDMPYTMISTGKKQVGGGVTQKQMPEAPTAWLPYVEVKSVKSSLAKAKKLGARIVVDYQAVPGTGGIGVFVDPTGAALGLWEPEKKRK